ncbi:MAG: TolC family protein [Myxococcales bacterium]|nr:MAG: TolC family protein [Myxococcales bacterium]
MLSRHFVPLLIFATAFGCTSCNSDDSGYKPTTDISDLCTTPLAPNEPLCSMAFGDTAWPGSHRGSYAQGSSPLPGPTEANTVVAEHIDLPGAPIIISFSAPYADGGRAAWSTVLGVSNAVIKVDHERFEVIDTYIPADREGDDAPTVPLGVSGAYAAIDSENQFIVGRTRFVSFFADSIEGDRSSPIELKKRIHMPAEAFCNEEDIIAGMSLTYDGHLAFATELGNLFVIPADADPDNLGDVPVISTNPDCATADRADLEIVSNSIAIDEDGGIYLVTSAAMYRFDWDGDALTLAWRTEYQTVEKPSPIRLGPGSGSTPSLMGTAADDDRFVVITDGQELMHVVLFWREEIPEDWEPITPGRDPRIACEMPIDFGTGATRTSSEQSVAVRGYSAILVNDLLVDPTIVDPETALPIEQNLISALEGGIPTKAPFGLEHVAWDPGTRTCASVWTNPDISVPNGIPSISEASRMVYGIGQRNGQWGLEGLDLDTGESRLWAPGGPGTCDPALIGVTGVLPSVAAVLQQAPGSCENSLYSATTVAPDAMVYTGTFFGMSRYVPDSFEDLSADAQVSAGIDQGLDLLDRAEAGSTAGQISVRDHLRRALVQVGTADDSARAGGLNQVSESLQAAQQSIDAAVQTLDAGGSIDADVAVARASLEEAKAAL